MPRPPCPTLLRVFKAPGVQDARPSFLKVQLLTSVVLVAALAAMGAYLELGRGTQVLHEGSVEMPSTRAADQSVEEMDGALRIVEGLRVESATRLRLLFRVDPIPTWCAIGVALVSEEGDVRELYLTQEVKASDPGSHEISAVIDQVEPGEYQLLLRPAYDGPLGGEAPPRPELTLRVEDDPGSPTFFWLALALLLLPPLILGLRGRRKLRRSESQDS